MDIPLKIRVALFLKEFKEIVTTGRGLDIIDRRENIKSLLELGFTKKHCREELLSLSKGKNESRKEGRYERPVPKL